MHLRAHVTMSRRSEHVGAGKDRGWASPDPCRRVSRAGGRQATSEQLGSERRERRLFARVFYETVLDDELFEEAVQRGREAGGASRIPRRVVGRVPALQRHGSGAGLRANRPDEGTRQDESAKLCRTFGAELMA